MNHNNEKDVVLVSLEFAKSKALKGEAMNASDLWSHLLDMKLVSEERKHRSFVSHLWARICAGSAGDQSYLSLDAYLGLLDYDELQQARKDSAEARAEAKTAVEFAKYSIWIAIGLGVIQIVIGIIQVIKC